MQTRTTGCSTTDASTAKCILLTIPSFIAPLGSPPIGSVADPWYLRKSHKNAIIGRNQRDYVTRLPDVRWGILMQR